MLNMSAKRYLAALVSVMAIGTFSFGATQARAGDITEDQIVNALTPTKKPLTRGLSIGGEAAKPVDPAQEKFVTSLRGRTRGLNLNEREELATIAKDKPNIDLTITFDYNSADISSKSLAAVQTLGRALTNPDLKGSTFVVAGHTDAAGAARPITRSCPSAAPTRSRNIWSTTITSLPPTSSPSAMARAS
jgi:outer membrane protein OmpA-like peptidoglycan-associated protein